MSELAPEDKDKFDQGKLNQINQWLDTGTVQKMLRYKIPPEQILRCRWALSWKTPEPGSTSGDRRAKARLVVLGYEDPQIDAILRDSPTLSKDSRMLVLQLIASRQWTVRSFDIKTAFLRGSRRDQRALGIEPPKEMREAMKLIEISLWASQCTISLVS